jgi:hypothetical protein
LPIQKDKKQEYPIPKDKIPIPKEKIQKSQIKNNFDI